MTRSTGIVLFLLLASNAAWVALWMAREEPAANSLFADAATEEQVAALQDEVQRLRAEAGPIVPGLVGAGGQRHAASDDSEATGDAPIPGAADGPEPAQAEEAAELAAQRKREAEIVEQVKATLRKIMQVKDGALRQEGLDELAAALQSADPKVVEYSLSALHALRATEVDRTVFRATVLDLLASEHGGIRRSALYALHATGVQPGDLRHVLAGAADEDPVVRQHLARVLRLYNDGVFEGEAAATLARLLRDESENVRRGTIRGLYGVVLPPAAEKALIEAAARPAERYDAVYHGLSVVKDKSRGVIDALFTHLDDENGQLRQRAHWGLQRGIPDDQKPYVARRYADSLDKFVNPQTHKEALQLIARFGDVSLVPQLERFADNDLVDARAREMARKAADYLRAK